MIRNRDEAVMAGATIIAGGVIIAVAVIVGQLPALTGVLAFEGHVLCIALISGLLGSSSQPGSTEGSGLDGTASSTGRGDKPASSSHATGRTK